LLPPSNLGWQKGVYCIPAKIAYKNLRELRKYFCKNNKNNKNSYQTLSKTEKKKNFPQGCCASENFVKYHSITYCRMIIERKKNFFVLFSDF
jgi:hypothetical protein